VTRQRLASFEHRGRRVAYATIGTGPPLLCDLGRLHHLDVFWRHPPYRTLVEALARRFTVVRWDRPGCGLSDRHDADFTIDGELALFDRLLAVLGLEEAAVVAAASSVPVMIAIAAERPARVQRLAVFGAWARQRPEAADYGVALDALLRTQPDLAIEVLAQSTAAGCDADALRWLVGAYKQVTSGEIIAQWLAEAVRIDVQAALGRVRCPTLVLHRRDDPSNDFDQSRDVAAGIADAVLLPLDGTAGVIWEGDVAALVRPLVGFLAGDASSPEAPAVADAVTARERDVAGLVALGFTNAEIADQLGIGRRTVESHLERLRAKLGLVTRAQVAAWASQGRGSA
jgi:DNA-binding CsgD family transcriptional regulator/pimeloyl-ACP methyl ester carboxylesterase